MLHLALHREPHWLALGHGVRVEVRPCSTALMMAARAEAQHVPGTTSTDSEATAQRSATLLKALARMAVLAWEGVGDADGTPLPVTPEGIDALLDLWPLADAFERLYLAPALLLDAEKNACGPAPSGTSAAGPSTAPAAQDNSDPVPAASAAVTDTAVLTSSTPR
jgi:hypothetical protein